MQNKKPLFLERIRANKDGFHSVVDFDPKKNKIASLDCTSANTGLSLIDLTDTNAFSNFIDSTLNISNAKYLIGGYNENRTVYGRSRLFDTSLDKNSATNKIASEEPRTLHLGTDIWGAEGTKIYAPLGGRVHSFAFNDHFGDYGATLILLHQLDGLLFHTLYGHLSLKDIGSLNEGKFLNRGECIAHFGPPAENGHWPPHLHFQLIIDMHNYKGDYPGVCALSKKEFYLDNCPDPDVILNLNRYI